jgi:glycine betaine transporter
MSYSISMSVTGKGNPPKLVRVFWVVVMGVISVILINIGEGSIDAIQSFIIITAVPISIIMSPVVWTAPKIAHKLAKEQGLVESKEKSNVLKFIIQNKTLNYTQKYKNKE